MTALQNTSATGYLIDSNNLTGYAQVVEEYRNVAAGTTAKVYTYGSGLISQAVLAPGSTLSALGYYGTDGLGSVRRLTNASGTVTDTWDYDAFGNLLSRTGTTDNIYLYRGEQFDPDLGMYSLRARFYNQNTGRFWNQDSYEGSAGDPASLHKYLYANADPVNGFDPSGYWSIGFGNAAHDAIQDAYEESHFDLRIKTGTTTGIYYKNPFYNIWRIIKPDIVNFDQKTWAEIKPFSPYGITTGISQMAAYATALVPLGFTPDLWPATPQPLVVKGKLISYFNAGGIIFYTDPDQNVLEIGALIALAAAENLTVTLGQVRSAYTVIRGTAQAGAAFARSADIAEVEAVPAEAGLAALLTGI